MDTYAGCVLQPTQAGTIHRISLRHLGQPKDQVLTQRSSEDDWVGCRLMSALRTFPGVGPTHREQVARPRATAAPPHPRHRYCGRYRISAGRLWEPFRAALSADKTAAAWQAHPSAPRCDHPAGEETQWDWVELPDPPAGWDGYEPPVLGHPSQFQRRPSAHSSCCLVIDGRAAQQSDHRPDPAFNQLHALLRDLIPGGADRNLAATTATKLLAAVRPIGAAETARKQLCRDLIAEIKNADNRLKSVTALIASTVAQHGTTLTVDGIGPVIAARLVGQTRRAGRFPTASAFASYAGVAPVEVARCRPSPSLASPRR